MKFKVVRAAEGTILPPKVYWLHSRASAEHEVERANNPEDHKGDYWAMALPGLVGGDTASRDYWGIGIDSEPEVNEWGEVGL